MPYKNRPYILFGLGSDYRREYVVDKDRLYIKPKFSGHAILPLEGATIEAQQGMLQKMFDIGNVEVHSQSGRHLVCHKVKNVSAFIAALRGEDNSAEKPDKAKQTPPHNIVFGDQVALIPLIGDFLIVPSGSRTLCILNHVRGWKSERGLIRETQY